MEFFMGKGKKFFEFATKLAQLMWLNILTILCSLPVITMGSAFTAMHYVLIQIYRDEENKITRSYFSSFKKNFWHSTKIWLIYLVFYAIMLVDYWALKNLDNSTIRYLNILVPALVFIGSLSMLWSFVLQARYELSVKDTLVFSITRIIAFPLRTLAMGIAFLAPFALGIYFPRFFIIVPLLGISGGGILCTWFYNGALKVMEDDDEEGDKNESESTS